MNTETTSNIPVLLFYSYSHKDEALLKELINHLTPLRNTKLISGWHDRKILAGDEWGDEISKYLEESDIILLLISSDFLASEYSQGVEVKRALERYNKGEAILIPVILRPVMWEMLPYGKIQALPKNALAVTNWENRDEAYKNICAGILLLLISRKFKQEDIDGEKDDDAVNINPLLTPAKKNLTREKVLDAALPANVTVGKTIVLVVMIRGKDSEGLKKIVRIDRKYKVDEKDVVSSETFPIEFPVDDEGKSLPFDLDIKVESPDFEQKTQSKSIEISPDGDSNLVIFFLTPDKTGDLFVNLEICNRGTIISTCLLETEASFSDSKDVSTNLKTVPITTEKSEKGEDNGGNNGGVGTSSGYYDDSNGDSNGDNSDENNDENNDIDNGSNDETNNWIAHNEQKPSERSLLSKIFFSLSNVNRGLVATLLFFISIGSISYIQFSDNIAFSQTSFLNSFIKFAGVILLLASTYLFLAPSFRKSKAIKESKRESQSKETFMSDKQVKQRFYPLKPKNREGFKKAVAWLGGRELIDSLKGTIIYAIYGENMDPRSWMKANIYPDVEKKLRYEYEKEVKDQVKADIKNESAVADEYKKLNFVQDTQTVSQMKDDPQFQNKVRQMANNEWTKKIFDQWEWKRTHFKFWENYLPEQHFWKNLSGSKKTDEFWFDYIADTGDGQVSVYGVACMCLSDLWLDGAEVGAEVRFDPPKLENTDGTGADEAKNLTLLPRGSYLFVGGDTAYHSANYATLFERFQTPFRWAFMSVRRFASKNYVLKQTASEKFFLSDGTRKNVFDPETNEPIADWDGTIGDYINGKLYWDTEPLRPLFGVPANHDYYDSIDGFNKQFRRPPFEEIEENMVYEDDKGRMFLQIPTFSREQEASYVALRLPFDWWMFGIDSENEKLDYRQELFFKQIMKNKPSKLILTTPEPTTVFGKLCGQKDKTANYLRSITESLGLEQPFFTDGNFKILPPKKSGEKKAENIFEKQLEMETEKAPDETDIFKNREICRLDISGDIHHYARYWGENTRKFDDLDFASENYASLVAGGGGAFFDSTETLIGEAYNPKGKRIRSDGNNEAVKGEIPPQKVYPTEQYSLHRMSDRLFDLWIIKKGGYVQWAGVIFAVIIFFLTTRFSHASKAFAEFNLLVKNLKDSILQTGVVTASQNIQSGVSGFFSEYSFAFITGLILTASIAFIFSSAYSLNQLIKKLKEKSFEETIDEEVDGGVPQLLKTFSPFFFAAALYILFIIYLPHEIKPFTKSFFLLLHFVLTGVLVWLSFDYSNWLPIRFKIARGYTTKTFSQIVEDPNVETKELYKQVLGQLSREFSYRDIPTFIFVFLAIANLIFGIRTFGNENLSKTLGDLLLLTVIFGGLFLVIFKLAYSTGAAYQNKKGKRRFALIGLFHALLQLFTPFIIFYYTNIYYFLPLLLLVFAVNGFPTTASRIKTLPPAIKSTLNFLRKFYSVLDYQGAAVIMRKNSPAFLTFCWIGYGLMFLAVPFILLGLFPNAPTPHSVVNSLTEWLVNYFNWQNDYYPRLWISVLMSLAVVGWLGYYLSRIWFSWYLSVSLAYNGHNNEAGGAARIEDFKFILRIKVESEQLTVYVIGFDEAEHELEKLKLKLVDKFTLKCKPVL